MIHIHFASSFLTTPAPPSPPQPPLSGDVEVGEEREGVKQGVDLNKSDPCCSNSCLFLLGASGKVRIDSSGDREPDYSLKYYVNGSFQNIADYSHSTGGFNLRGRHQNSNSPYFHRTFPIILL